MIQSVVEGRTGRATFFSSDSRKLNVHGYDIKIVSQLAHCLNIRKFLKISLIRRRHHHHRHHHHHHTLNLITLQRLWMLHTCKCYTFCRYMILTVSQGGESFAETSFIRKIQRIKSNSGLLFALFDIFKIHTHSTKQDNMGLLRHYFITPNWCTQL